MRKLKLANIFIKVKN